MVRAHCSLAEIVLISTVVMEMCINCLNECVLNKTLESPHYVDAWKLFIVLTHLAFVEECFTYVTSECSICSDSF